MCTSSTLLSSRFWHTLCGKPMSVCGLRLLFLLLIEVAGRPSKRAKNTSGGACERGGVAGFVCGWDMSPTDQFSVHERNPWMRHVIDMTSARNSIHLRSTVFICEKRILTISQGVPDSLFNQRYHIFLIHDIDLESLTFETHLKYTTAYCVHQPFLAIYSRHLNPSNRRQKKT